MATLPRPCARPRLGARPGTAPGFAAACQRQRSPLVEKESLSTPGFGQPAGRGCAVTMMLSS